ncbi:hypothetical protein QQS21_007752 [Conoideocrella luteorostrata]|uniref:Uncharacterized protein n=1 Tax=Conoideocrella luteorostrata TaxID=1105319 RepID=A0AAJ0CK48_9HYPO|nr:hypothetical protein QQS21_007752 [Conoideocrella luteorostrata]
MPATTKKEITVPSDLEGIVVDFDTAQAAFEGLDGTLLRSLDGPLSEGLESAAAGTESDSLVAGFAGLVARNPAGPAGAGILAADVAGIPVRADILVADVAEIPVRADILGLDDADVLADTALLGAIILVGTFARAY